MKHEIRALGYITECLVYLLLTLVGLMTDQRGYNFAATFVLAVMLVFAYRQGYMKRPRKKRDQATNT